MRTLEKWGYNKQKKKIRDQWKNRVVEKRGNRGKERKAYERFNCRNSSILQTRGRGSLYSP